MTKIIYLLFLSTCFNPILAKPTTDNLIKLAHNYLTFIDDVGSAHSVKDNDSRIETLFAENLTKIDNRTTLFKNNRQELLSQMRGFEKKYDPTANTADWTVNIKDALIVPSPSTNAVVIYFDWIHINIGRGTTMVILQCNAKDQIECITDVWAKVQ